MFMKKRIAKMDLWLLVATIILMAFGLIMVYTASSFLTVDQQGVSSNYYFIKQAIFFGISLLISFVVVLRMKTDKYKYFTPLLIIGIIVALAGLFLYGGLL